MEEEATVYVRVDVIDSTPTVALHARGCGGSERAKEPQLGAGRQIDGPTDCDY